ncbi:MAG: hypothetical protein ABW022_04290 [Actinoplanes sp.]
MAKPQHVEGTDRTGTVRVVLGADGIPTQVSVRDGWQQRLEPQELGAAVLGANNDALGSAMRAWAMAMDDGRWQHRDQLPDGTSAPAVPGSPELAAGQARDSNELAEEVLTQLHALQVPPTAAPAEEQAQDDGRHVTIRIGASGVSACAVDARWANNRDGASISAALTVALRRAAAQRPAPPPSSADLDALIGDALATLTALTAHPRTEGGPR